MELGLHRSYRTITRTGLPFWLDSILLTIISAVSIYFYVTLFHNYFMEFFYQVLVAHGLQESLMTLSVYMTDLLVVDIPFAYNKSTTLYTALVVIVVTTFILMKQTIIPLNVVLWISFIFLMVTIFLLYFIFLGDHYPYSAEKYFDLYLHAYIGFMLMCFVILSFSLALMPEPFLRKIVILVGAIIYYFIYSFVRLGATIILTSQVSVIFSPLMYFTIFYDFILIIYIFTIVLYKNVVKSSRRRV